jgi:hypothetical protein
MAGFSIAALAALLPFVLGRFGLGRPLVVATVGAVLAVGWLVALAAKPASDSNPVPLWYVSGLVALLYAIWCGGLWLGARLRRLRRATPG